MLKNVVLPLHTRHRSVHNFLMNILATVTAYCFSATKPEVRLYPLKFDIEVPESNGQLVLRE